MNESFLNAIKQIQALALNGLEHAESHYDLDRYEELRRIADRMMSEISQTELSKIQHLFADERGYQTPKVDVRAVIFKNERILLVQEKNDRCWSLPGGWADVGFSPAENAAKEVIEEAGLEVKPVRLLAIIDKKNHPHPSSPFYIYKLFLKCEQTGGTPVPGSETLDVGYFSRDELPELSINRVTQNQLELMFEFLNDPKKETVIE